MFVLPFMVNKDVHESSTGALKAA